MQTILDNNIHFIIKNVTNFIIAVFVYMARCLQQHINEVLNFISNLITCSVQNDVYKEL